MKKMIVLISIMMLLTSTIILAQSLIPYPIFAKLNAGVPIGSGIDVKIQNIDCTDSSKCVIERTFQTNDNGEIALDAYDPQRGFIGFRDSDRFKATILYCQGEEVCNQEASFTSSGGRILFNFDLTKSTCLPPTVKEVPVETVVYQDKNVYVCSDGTARDTNDCPTIPAVDINYAIIIIVGIITFVVGSGLKIYRKLDGSVAVQHKHKNTTGYHDPNIVHKVQPHKKGEIVPKYEEAKGTDGYYKYLG